MAAVLDRFYGTGRRKTSVARVWIKPGSGHIVVNRRAFEDYFPRETLRMIIAQPLAITNPVGHFDDKLRQPLKKAGLLTRDPRARERKKYGQPGARQKFQYSKR